MTSDYFKERIKIINDCWIWKLSVHHTGYGKLTMNGKSESSHRASFIVHKSKIPKGHYVLHKCDNRLCVNPDHLYLGDAKQNSKDMKERHPYFHSREKKKFCKNGHEFSVENTYVYERKDKRVLRICKKCDRKRHTKGNL